MFKKVFEKFKQNGALVHNITNYVTVNDCANAILALGGSPIMADDIGEVEEITTICSSLTINIGTLNQRTIESMKIAGRKANQLNHPVVLDPVGAGASSLRTRTALELIDTTQFAVIRGNMSEIKTIALGSGKTQGVDACESDNVSEDNLQEMVGFAKALSKKLNSVIAITGKIDIIADANCAYVCRNGHAMMSKITGTGCMLSAMIGAMIGANPQDILEATACAVAIMGISGELAYQKMTEMHSGSSSLRTYIIDNISTLCYDDIARLAKVELI